MGDEPHRIDAVRRAVETGKRLAGAQRRQRFRDMQGPDISAGVDELQPGASLYGEGSPAHLRPIGGNRQVDVVRMRESVVGDRQRVQLVPARLAEAQPPR